MIGLGQRGMPAIRMLSGIPGAEVTAICDLRQEAIDAAMNFFRWRNWIDKAQAVAVRDSNTNSHNDVDAMFQMRLVYCLRSGLPLPQDVYDLAAWSCICELTERSVCSRSKAVDVPDFTRGAWRTTPRMPEFDHA